MFCRENSESTVLSPLPYRTRFDDSSSSERITRLTKMFLMGALSRYEGEWSRGKRSGWGCLKTAAGDAYEGEWRDDKVF